MPKVLVIHGPNLNLLGKREPEIYGRETLADVNKKMEDLARELGLDLDFIQSNHEGEIIDKIQSAMGNTDAVMINPGGFTHTSVAIRDALLGSEMPFIEVHLSNVQAREEFRHHSYFSDVAKGTIAGFGYHSYLLGLRAVKAMLE